MAKKKKPGLNYDEVLKVVPTSLLENELEQREQFQETVDDIREALQNALSELDYIEESSNRLEEYLTTAQAQANNVVSTLANR